MTYATIVAGIIISFGFITMGTLAVAVTLRQCKTAWAMEGWHSTRAEVRSSRIEMRHGYYEPCIEYAFTVDGQEIVGNRRALYRRGSSDRVWADTIVSEHPVGSRVIVYYDPKNPRQCILNRKNARAYGAAMPLIGVGFAAIGIAFLDYVVSLARAS